jgi:hypothetical protein
MILLKQCFEAGYEPVCHWLRAIERILAFVFSDSLGHAATISAKPESQGPPDNSKSLLRGPPFVPPFCPISEFSRFPADCSDHAGGTFAVGGGGAFGSLCGCFEC